MPIERGVFRCGWNWTPRAFVSEGNVRRVLLWQGYIHQQPRLWSAQDSVQRKAEHREAGVAGVRVLLPPV